MRILFITLSNIGDVILSLPALDTLRQNFPDARITCLCADRPKEIFENNPKIDKLVIYNKRWSLKEKIRLFFRLKKEKYDIIVDLRNTFFGALLPAAYKTSPFKVIPKEIRHMKERHILRLPKIAKSYQRLLKVRDAKSLNIKKEDEDYIDKILSENNIGEKDKIVVIGAGARSHTKRWPADKFIELIPSLVEDFGLKVILAGDKDDSAVTKYIAQHSAYPVLDLAGKTTLLQLAALLKKTSLVITCDSALLHLSSYQNKPVVAIFGPTNELKYGPWSETYAVAKKEIFCRPCEKAQCRFGTLACLHSVKADDVLEAIKNLTSPFTPHPSPITPHLSPIKRILIVRTDRIGDVLLSTPVIKACRKNFPHAYIAMMVSPYAKEIVDGNPYLDEVIIYDKEGKHRSWARSIKFARNLGKKKFDLALLLHPTNRAHLITFFAGIKRRIGYDRKLAFLLTDKIKHTKHLGEKHELEYNLDLVRYLGIEPEDKDIFLPVKKESDKWAEVLLKEQGITREDRILVIHPGASCPSKIWPHERFAEVANRLSEKFGLKIVAVAGPKDLAVCKRVVEKIKYPVVDLAGKTSVSQLAGILKKCTLFISNDSGPVHLASAVGVPVISIFGRSQKGLSPKRWGPTGKNSRVAYKTVGCVECLAHNCVRDFACLKAVTVDYVLSLADSLLSAK